MQQQRQHRKIEEISTDRFEQTKAILESTPPQTAKEQDEYTESSLSLALAPVLASITNCPGCNFEVEEKRHNQVVRTLRLLLQPAVSARCHLGFFCKSFIGKAPRSCTSERTLSSGAK